MFDQIKRVRKLLRCQRAKSTNYFSWHISEKRSLGDAQDALVASQLSSLNINISSSVQIMNEEVCLSHSIKTIEKGMYPTILWALSKYYDCAF